MAVQTMRDTGRDSKPKHKETSRGRLAVSVVECRARRLGFAVMNAARKPEKPQRSMLASIR